MFHFFQLMSLFLQKILQSGGKFCIFSSTHNVSLFFFMRNEVSNVLKATSYGKNIFLERFQTLRIVSRTHSNNLFCQFLNENATCTISVVSKISED